MVINILDTACISISSVCNLKFMNYFITIRTLQSQFFYNQSIVICIVGASCKNEKFICRTCMCNSKRSILKFTYNIKLLNNITGSIHFYNLCSISISRCIFSKHK